MRTRFSITNFHTIFIIAIDIVEIQQSRWKKKSFITHYDRSINRHITIIISQEIKIKRGRAVLTLSHYYLFIQNSQKLDIKNRLVPVLSRVAARAQDEDGFR